MQNALRYRKQALDLLKKAENAENKESKWFWVDKILKEKEANDKYITKKYILTLSCDDIKINYEIIEKIGLMNIQKQYYLLVHLV